MTPLLLLPGLVCDRAIWAPLLPALAPHAQCSVADYGRLDSLAAMAAHVLATAPPRFALAGHSMGGRVALEVMRAAPQRVERLALLDTGYQSRMPGLPGAAETAQRYGLLDIARREGMRAMGEKWLTGMLPPARLADTATFTFFHFFSVFGNKEIKDLGNRTRRHIGFKNLFDFFYFISCFFFCLSADAVFCIVFIEQTSAGFNEHS